MPEMTPKEAYAEALERWEVPPHKVDELDLSSLGLTRLPPELGQLSKLTELDLSYNQAAMRSIWASWLISRSYFSTTTN